MNEINAIVKDGRCIMKTKRLRFASMDLHSSIEHYCFECNRIKSKFFNSHSRWSLVPTLMIFGLCALRLDCEWLMVEFHSLGKRALFSERLSFEFIHNKEIFKFNKILWRTE